MRDEIAISIAFTNISKKRIREDALDALHLGLGSKLRWPNPPPGIAGGSVDLWAIASKISDVLQIGTVLWAVYAKVIHRKTAAPSEEGLYVVLPLPGGSKKFWLGAEYVDKESFMLAWTGVVKKLVRNKSTAKSIHNSKKRKRRRRRY